MGKPIKEQGEEKTKNIKNIYVSKINSLMRLSRDNLGEEEYDIYSQTKQKKIKKVLSQSIQLQNSADKTTLKLEKNRQSARKARQRKNLYIKLLECQVTMLKDTLTQGQALERESEQFLSSLELKNTSQDQLDKYISRDNLGEPNSEEMARKQKLNHMDLIVDEIYNTFNPEMLHKITSMEKKRVRQFETKILERISENQIINEQEKNEAQSDMRMLMNSVISYKQQSDQNFEKIYAINSGAKQLVNSSICPYSISSISNEPYLKDQIKNIVKQMNLSCARIPEEKLIANILSEKKSNQVSVRIQSAEQKIHNYNQFINKAIQIQK